MSFNTSNKVLDMKGQSIKIWDMDKENSSIKMEGCTKVWFNVMIGNWKFNKMDGFGKLYYQSGKIAY